MNRYLVLTVIAAGVIIIDQASKFAILHMMNLYDQKEIIPGFFNLIYVQNPGAAFGLFGSTSESIRSVFLIGISFLALSVLFYMYVRLTEESILVNSAIGMIVGGAIGNLIDRIRLHSVIDFLDFQIKGYHWPTFNLADSAITMGTIILLFHVVLPKRKHIINA